MTTLDIARIQTLFTPAAIRQLEDMLYYRDDDGSYHMFDQYRIAHERGVYRVYVYGQPHEHHFSQLRYALCWCINHRRNRVLAQREIVELDSQLCSLGVDIKIQQKLLNTVNKDVHANKLNEATLRHRHIGRKLQACVDECNRWQTQKFGRSLNLDSK